MLPLECKTKITVKSLLEMIANHFLNCFYTSGPFVIVFIFQINCAIINQREIKTSYLVNVTITVEQSSFTSQDGV